MLYAFVQSTIQVDFMRNNGQLINSRFVLTVKVGMLASPHGRGGLHPKSPLHRSISCEIMLN